MSQMVTCPLGTRCLTGNKYHQRGSQSLKNCQQAGQGKTAATSAADISQGFVSETTENQVTIGGENWGDVLIDRYGEDVRELDEQRKVLGYNHAQYQQNYLSLKKALDERVKRGSDTPKQHEMVDNAHAEMVKARDERDRFNQENPVDYPQYWLVEKGHFHDSLNCSTLQPGTRVSLYTPASGMEQDEAIQIAGSRVCTHCVPDAPVDVLNSPSRVFTDEERAQEQSRVEREEKARLKKEEAAQRAEKRHLQEIERQKKMAGDSLAEEVEVPFLNNGGYASPGDTAKTAKAARDAVKRSFISAVTSQMTLLHGYDDNELASRDVEGLQYNAQLSPEKREECAQVLLNATEKGRYWAASISMGNIDQMVDDLEKVNYAVGALAAKKGKTSDQMVDELFNKRSMNSMLGQAKRSIRAREYWQDNPNADEDMTERLRAVESWVRDPQSYREYLEGN